MLALLRYHYRDADIAERTEEELLDLFAQLEWVRKKEKEAEAPPHGTAH